MSLIHKLHEGNISAYQKLCALCIPEAQFMFQGSNQLPSGGDLFLALLP